MLNSNKFSTHLHEMFCHVLAYITFSLLCEERRSKKEEKEKGGKRGEIEHPASCRHSDSYRSHHDPKTVVCYWLMKYYFDFKMGLR